MDQSRDRVYRGTVVGLEMEKTCSKGKVEGGGDEFRLKGKTSIAHSGEKWEQKKGKWIQVRSVYSRKALC